MHVSLTRVSMNAKTGPIPVSTSTKAWCPSGCSLKGNGCYADSGPLAIHWKRITEGVRGVEWDEFCEQIDKLPRDQLWRHNQAGDLPGDGEELDVDMLMQLCEANEGRRGFTYTHYDPFTNRDAIAAANECGFTVNISAESLEEADHFAALQCGPVVTLLPITTETKCVTPQGRRVVVCPATYRDDVSCATCQLCQRQRDVIVGFPAHGTSKAKAQRVFMLKNVTQ